jgi:hypothetical protein
VRYLVEECRKESEGQTNNSTGKTVNVFSTKGK